jgi:hypothetical protein
MPVPVGAALESEVASGVVVFAAAVASVASVAFGAFVASGTSPASGCVIASGAAVASTLASCTPASRRPALATGATRMGADTPWLFSA